MSAYMAGMVIKLIFRYIKFYQEENFMLNVADQKIGFTLEIKCVLYKIHLIIRIIYSAHVISLSLFCGW